MYPPIDDTMLLKSCLNPLTSSYKTVIDLLYSSAVSNSLVVIVNFVILFKLYKLIEKV